MAGPTAITRRARGTTLDEIEAVYQARHVSFLRVAGAITGSPEAGQDAVQEALARALASRKSFRSAGSLEAWLWKIVVNAARNVRRSSQSGGPANEEHEQREQDPAGDAIRTAVAALPERQRHVLFLRYYADLDYASIATALGVRRGTVSATLNQAHAALHRLLGEEVSA